jgi:hypothetical protein
MRLRVANIIVMVVERTATAKTRTQCDGHRNDENTANFNVEVGCAAVGLLERGLMELLLTCSIQEKKKLLQ